jgi:hypothetical protein
MNDGIIYASKSELAAFMSGICMMGVLCLVLIALLASEIGTRRRKW